MSIFFREIISRTIGTDGSAEVSWQDPWIRGSKRHVAQFLREETQESIRWVQQTELDIPKCVEDARLSFEAIYQISIRKLEALDTFQALCRKCGSLSIGRRLSWDVFRLECSCSLCGFQWHAKTLDAPEDEA